MKEVKTKIINVLSGILRIAVSLACLILLFILLRAAGWRGLIAFFAGMALMAYLILSKNFMLNYIIKSTKSGDYINELKEKKKEKRNANG